MGTIDQILKIDLGLRALDNSGNDRPHSSHMSRERAWAVRGGASTHEDQERMQALQEICKASHPTLCPLLPTSLSTARPTLSSCTDCPCIPLTGRACCLQKSLLRFCPLSGELLPPPPAPGQLPPILPLLLILLLLLTLPPTHYVSASEESSGTSSPIAFSQSTLLPSAKSFSPEGAHGDLI